MLRFLMAGLAVDRIQDVEQEMFIHLRLQVVQLRLLPQQLLNVHLVHEFLLPGHHRIITIEQNARLILLLSLRHRRHVAMTAGIHLGSQQIHWLYQRPVQNQVA